MAQKVNDEFPVLFERRLSMRKHGDTSSNDVVIQIGHPYWVDQDVEAACPVAIRGLLGRLADVRGIDQLDAVRLAINLIDSTLRKRASEVEFFWPDGESYFDDLPNP
jgi:hypothetical protein